MSSIRNLLCATLAVGVLFSAPRAEARFGKHSNSSSSSSSSSGKSNDSSSSSGSSSHHHSSSSAALFLVDLLLDLLVDAHPAVAYVASNPPPPPQQQEQEQPPPPAEEAPRSQVQASASEPSSELFVRLGVDGAALNTAAGLSAFLGVEGERFGIDARAMALVTPTDDGTQGEDNLSLMNFHLTYAVIAQERARLRLEGGLSSAHAPHLTVVGPSVGLSFEAGLAGNLDLELRAMGTAYPFKQLDGQAGLALHLNSLVLRGGWRRMYLNDNGLVDDVVHEDTFGGPYLGVGFAFF